MSQLSFSPKECLVTALGISDFQRSVQLLIDGLVFQQSFQLLVVESFLVWLLFRVVIKEIHFPILIISDHCYFELHQVHGQGPRFITENVLNLSQFLIQ